MNQLYEENPQRSQFAHAIGVLNKIIMHARTEFDGGYVVKENGNKAVRLYAIKRRVGCEQTVSVLVMLVKQNCFCL